MKKTFISIAKKHECSVSNFKTERSDMGYQMYFLDLIVQDGNSFPYEYSFPFGSLEHYRKNIEKDFDEFIRIKPGTFKPSGLYGCT